MNLVPPRRYWLTGASSGIGAELAKALLDSGAHVAVSSRSKAPLEQLALSPQCGFASTEEGNVLTEEQQWAKMREIVELADEVWG